jgi:ATP synthase protein I
MEQQKLARISSEIRNFRNLGIELVANTFVGLALGYWLDKKFNSSPWLLIAGILLGSAAGFLQIYKVLFYEEKKKEK